MATGSRPERLEKSSLRRFFEKGVKPESAFGVGLEYERFGVRDEGAEAGRDRRTAAGGSTPRFTPLPIDGPISVSAVLDRLVQERGWKPKVLDGRMLELERGSSRITLEPGGQMELSGATHRSLHDAAEELGRYLREVRAVSEPLGIRWVASGTHPTASLDEIPWLPKKRYDIMRQYLPTRGAHAHQMMKGTCGAQVNLDFSSEPDAMEKLRVAMAISAVVSAMLANSPITAGRPNGALSERSAVWLDTDPDRSGLLRFAFSPSSGFDDYVEWALSVPMFFLVRDGRWIPMNGRTFGDFLDHGHESYVATWEDWELHLTTLFPDVRLKAYIEVRGTDSNTPPLVLAHAALWKGIFYGGRETLQAAYALLVDLTWDERLQLRADASRLGLAARAGSRPLLEVARELVDIADSGLERAGAGADAVWLDPLHEKTSRAGRTPAEDLLAAYGSGGESGLTAVVDHASSLAPFV